MATPGYGRSQAAKTTAGYKRQLEVEKLKTELFDVNKCTDDVIMKLNGKLLDREARRWYLEQDRRIPEMIDKSLPLEEQAKQAFELRNKFRTQTRDLMKDQEKRKILDREEPNKTFEELIVKKCERKNYLVKKLIRI